MKTLFRIALVFCAFSFIFNAFSQNNPLVYVESSVGMASPEWEGGDSELEFADINQDGHPDIITIGDHGNPGIQSGEQGIMVYLNNGSGQWSAVMEGDLGYGGIAVGDVNNDGHPDVGYGMHHNYSSTDLGNQLIEVALGNGTASGWVPWDNGLATAGEDWGMFGTDFGDVDNDGDLDIGSISFGCCSGAHVYLNNLDGSWTHSWGFTEGNAEDIFVFGDINNDGYLDIATAHENGTIYFGDGTGSFTLKDINLPPAGSYGRSGVSLGDVDGDGGKDLAYVDLNGGVHVYIWNDADGQWNDWSEGLPASGTAELSQLCDMNADGNMDLAVFGNANFQLWLGDGKGSWTADATFTTQTSGQAHAFRTGGDIDHNGKPDLTLLVEIGTWISYQNYLKCYKENSAVFSLNIKPAYPRGGEYFYQECVRKIQWTSAVPSGQASLVTLELSSTGPEGPWTTIAAEIPNNGEYQWLVPDVNSLNCYIRHTVMTGSDTSVAITPNAFKISDGTAAIPGPDPNAGNIHLFPNPARCGSSVRLEYPSFKLNSLSIHDLTGRHILTLDGASEISQGTGGMELPVPGIPGIYLVKCHSAEGIFTLKLMAVR